MDVEASVRAFIEKTFLVDKDKTISTDESLLDSGLVDSTAVVELLTFIEGEFGIQVEDEEVVPENFETIEAIVALVDSKRHA